MSQQDQFGYGSGDKIINYIPLLISYGFTKYSSLFGLSISSFFFFFIFKCGCLSGSNNLNLHLENAFF